MKRRTLIVPLLVLTVIVASAAILIRRSRPDWRPLPVGGKVCICRVTYEKNAHVTFGGSPLHMIRGAIPRILQPMWSRLAGPAPAEWWLPARDPVFAVWAVEYLPNAKSPGLEKLLLILPDGQEVSGLSGGWVVGTKYRLRPFTFDPSLQTLPRLHLRLFAQDHPEPIDFDLPNPVHDAPSADPAK